MFFWLYLMKQKLLLIISIISLFILEIELENYGVGYGLFNPNLPYKLNTDFDKYQGCWNFFGLDAIVANKPQMICELRQYTCKARWFWAECTSTWLLWYFLLVSRLVAQKFIESKWKLASNLLLLFSLFFILLFFFYFSQSFYNFCRLCSC